MVNTPLPRLPDIERSVDSTGVGIAHAGNAFPTAGHGQLAVRGEGHAGLPRREDRLTDTISRFHVPHTEGFPGRREPFAVSRPVRAIDRAEWVFGAPGPQQCDAGDVPDANR